MNQKPYLLTNHISKMKKAQHFLVMLFAMSIGLIGTAQIQQAGTPYNWHKKKLDKIVIPIIEMDQLNMKSIEEEDEVVDQYKETPYRFGIEKEVDVDLFSEGKETILPKGDKLYQLAFYCPKATSINFLFNEFSIPEGGQLTIWSADRTEFIGAFNHLNNKEYNSFAVGLVHSNKVVIEYYEQAGVTEQAEINIGTVIHGYRSVVNKFDDPAKGPYGNSGSCNMNVNCPDGAPWQNEKRGVALILNGGQAWCTGSLINNTAEDGSSYFLTAAHCDANESNWVFYFNHESSGCTGSTGPTNQSISGATQLASGAASDYHLVQLSTSVPSSYEPYYNGWDRSGNAVSTAVGIHHPAGDIKKISFDDDPLTKTSYLSNTSTSNGNHWRVETWERNTTTEGGSSGSPLFDQNHRIIGQLHGGYAACGNSSSDWYGALGSSWSGLASYLDPLGTGATTLDAYDPNSGPGATCSDGIQNQGETGIDCGGPCTACACNGTNVTVSITLDNYPEETSWSITQSGTTVASGGTYASQPDGSTVNIDVCLADGCYDFTINDQYGDGICCSYGSGSYTVSSSQGTHASGGSFTFNETTNFCLGGGPAPTCSDGIQNQGETGVDCGGPCAACASCNDGIQNQGETGVDCGGPCSACPTCNDGIQNQGETGVDCGGPCSACPTCNDGIQNGDETGIDCGGSCAPCGGGSCTYSTIDFHDFEANWGIWNDGGSDCRRSANDANYSFSGSRSARLRDNSSSSVTTTDNLNLSNFEEITVEFYFYARSMENGEDFWLQISTNGGSSYTTVASYASGSSFDNNTFYVDDVVISGPFTSNTRIRFRCDASTNSDYVYIDDVTISGCSVGSTPNPNGSSENEEFAVVRSGIQEVDAKMDMTIYPNPADQFLNLSFTSEDEETMKMVIRDIQGRVIEEQSLNSVIGVNEVKISTQDLEAGTYIMTIYGKAEMRTQRFVVKR